MKKFLLTAFSLLGLVVCAKAQDATDPKVEYIKKYSPIAVSEMKYKKPHIDMNKLK